MKTVYIVEWIEVEFGQRPEGYRVFTDIEVEFGQRPEGYRVFTDKGDCMRETRKDSQEGAYSGGYIGPARPLCYYEVPLACFPKEVQKTLRENGRSHTKNYWEPKFKSQANYIK
jgi:hypothetical protein